MTDTQREESDKETERDKNGGEGGRDTERERSIQNRKRSIMRGEVTQHSTGKGKEREGEGRRWKDMEGEGRLMVGMEKLEMEEKRVTEGRRGTERYSEREREE